MKLIVSVIYWECIPTTYLHNAIDQIEQSGIGEHIEKLLLFIKQNINIYYIR